MHALYVVSVWLHILAAVVWIGGMTFLGLVLVPVLRRPEYRNVANGLMSGAGVRFRSVGWISLVMLVLTGAFNLAYRGVGWDDVRAGRAFVGSFGHTLAIKLFLVAVILLMSALHDFVIGPRAAALARADHASPGAIRSRRQASWLGRLNMLLGVVIVALGVMLIRGWPW